VGTGFLRDYHTRLSIHDFGTSTWAEFPIGFTVPCLSPKKLSKTIVLLIIIVYTLVKTEYTKRGYPMFIPITIMRGQKNGNIPHGTGKRGTIENNTHLIIKPGLSRQTIVKNLESMTT
jgi:hypothetical protein